MVQGREASFIGKMVPRLSTLNDEYTFWFDYNDGDD